MQEGAHQKDAVAMDHGREGEIDQEKEYCLYTWVFKVYIAIFFYSNFVKKSIFSFNSLLFEKEYEFFKVK